MEVYVQSCGIYENTLCGRVLILAVYIVTIRFTVLRLRTGTPLS
jgi:hypothetical protein